MEEAGTARGLRLAFLTKRGFELEATNRGTTMPGVLRRVSRFTSLERPPTEPSAEPEKLACQPGKEVYRDRKTRQASQRRRWQMRGPRPSPMHVLHYI